jgi:DNA-directed RNA polymerase subunit RPC12/RpoP
MSEFKYACPVCGQHIKCDSSQSGTQMECPTCFQKIIVPQAPTDEQKFILTGTKVGGERPLPKAPEANPYASPPRKSLSGVMVVVIIFLFIAAAVGFVYHGTIFKKASPAPTPTPDAGTSRTNQSVVKNTPPVIVAPPANDTNWTLNLKGVAIPADTAAGRVEGQNFVCERASYSNGSLSLRSGDLGISVSFGGAPIESLAGKTINVTTNAASAARVALRWKVGDQTMRESFTNDYAMMLSFSILTNNHFSGKIYLCTSDNKKSYVAGTFDAEVRKTKPRN